MLKEKVVYSEELPVNVLVSDIREYNIHFHDDPEIIFVLQGSVRLRVGYYDYLLGQGDVFVVNDRELHSFENTGEPNMTLTMQLELEYFSKYYNNLKNTFFITDMAGPQTGGYRALVSTLLRIVKNIIRKGPGYERNVIENTHNLISCLLSDFRYFEVDGDKFINVPRKQKNRDLVDRMNRITDYMYSNYSRKISLEEIADREQLSIYYLSHLIREATGLSFQELLSFIRVEQSEHLLLGTEKKISAISAETGFSAVRYYRNHFGKWFGMPPEDYRKKYTGKASGSDNQAVMKKYSPDEIRKAIRAQSRNKGLLAGSSDRIYKALDIDIKSISGEKKEEEREGLSGTLLSMGLKNISPAIKPYRMFDDLRENILVDEGNYAVSTPDKRHDTLSRLSIIYYNLDGHIEKSIAAADGIEEAYEIIADYDADSEMLMNFHGMSGEFNVSRYRMSHDNLIAAYREVLRNGAGPARRKTAEKWRAMPSAEFSELTASGTLGIHIALKGFAAELIFIDRK